MKRLIATVDEDFAEIDRLMRVLRNRIASAAEAVHVVAEKAANRQRRSPRKTAKRR